MFVTHLQIAVGDSILASTIKDVISFTEARGWPVEDLENRAKLCQEATADARAAGVFGHEISIVNCGQITDLVDIGDISHHGHGLVVNTKLQIPSLFFVEDGMVRASHINFDFQDYTRFEFMEGKMMIRDLSEVDKTMLRLASNIVKETNEDGSVAERVG